MDTRLVHLFTSIVAGPTGCGKATFVVSLLRHSHTLVNLPPEKITWCCGEWQPLYSTLSTIHPYLECVEGLPDLSSFDSKNRNMVVIDDLMSETDERVTKLLTKKSYHCNTSVIYFNKASQQPVRVTIDKTPITPDEEAKETRAENDVENEIVDSVPKRGEAMVIGTRHVHT